MKRSGSAGVVLAALLGNSLIAVIKLAVALLTRSSAMFAEAIHSFVDSGNQVLLLFGGWRAARPADTAHPFGHGKEAYFWSFLVANLLFAIGAIASIHEGVSKIVHPHSIDHVGWIYAILAASATIEAWSLNTAVVEFRKIRKKMNGRMGLLGAIRAITDSNVLVVLAEDTSAIVGLTIAFLGVLLANVTGNPAFDAGASIVIGLLLACVAFFLANEIRLLLTGEGLRREDVDVVRAATLSVNGISSVSSIRTMCLGPSGAIVAIDADFGDTLTTTDVERITEEVRMAVKRVFPEATHVYLNAVDAPKPPFAKTKAVPKPKTTP